jgi:putative copper export protein
MTEPIAWPLLAARFCLLLLSVGLFGEACFDLYAPAAVRRPAPTIWRTVAPLAAAVAAFAWIAVVASESAGAETFPSLVAIVQLCILTGMGRALAVAALLALVLAGLALPANRRARVRAALAGGLLVTLACVSHAGGRPGGFSAVARIAVMAAHLLAVGVWLGGLLPLARALPKAGGETARLLREFGRIALAAVALAVTTGMITAAAVLTLAGGAPGRTYLKIFGLKLALVAAMLALASFNRWRLTPLAERDPGGAVRAFTWTLVGEQVFAFAVIGAASLLGQSNPSL